METDMLGKIDGFVKSPYAVLRFILPFDKLRAGYHPLMVSLSNHARLASGAFYEVAEFSRFFDFLRVHQYYPLHPVG